jgi:hypothetical protein
VLVNLLTTLEEEDSRNVANTILSSNLVAILTYVTLADDNLAIILLSKFVDDRAYHTARTTPSCPEINNYRHTLAHYLLKVLVVKF